MCTDYIIYLEIRGFIINGDLSSVTLLMPREGLLGLRPAVAFGYEPAFSPLRPTHIKITAVGCYFYMCRERDSNPHEVALMGF